MLARKYEGKAFFTISETTPEEYHHILNLRKFANSGTADFKVMCDEAKPGEDGWKVFKATSGKLIVASAMARMEGYTCKIKQLAIHPFYRGRNPHELLFAHMEKVFSCAKAFEGKTCTSNNENRAAFEGAGFRELRQETDSHGDAYVYYGK